MAHGLGYDVTAIRHSSPQKMQDYLYSITFNEYDYADGSFYYSRYAPPSGGCSVVRNGRYYGRNFDYPYSNIAEFCIRTKATDEKHWSIGVAMGTSNLTNEFVESGESHEDYKYLPFLTVDGVNDAGVVCNVNMTSAGDKGFTKEIGDGEPLASGMIVRYILDYADSAADGVALLRGRKIIGHFKDGVYEEFHWMIADRDSTYIIEFVSDSDGSMRMNVLSDQDDEYDDIPNGKPIMTNFYLTDWDGETVTGFERGGITPEDTTLTAHATGTERYDILLAGYDDAGTQAGMANLMKQVLYTKAYTGIYDKPFWYSEYTGDDEYGDITVYMSKNDPALLEKVELFRNAYEHRDRSNPQTWHTLHSVVYDMERMTMSVLAQEDAEGVRHEVSITEQQPPERYRDVVVNGGEPVNIYMQGENLATRVSFPLTEFLDEFGPGEPQLIVLRSRGDMPYVSMNTKREGDRLYWFPDATDTAKEGTGECQLRWYVGAQLAKSVVRRLSIKRSIDMQIQGVKEPSESWLEKMLDASISAQVASSVAADSADIAEAASRAAEAAEEAAELSNIAASGAAVDATASALAAQEAAEDAYASSSAAAGYADDALSSKTDAQEAAQSAEMARDSTGITRADVVVTTLPPTGVATGTVSIVGTTPYRTLKLEFGLPRGATGNPGYTPIRGVDYFTRADIDYIVQEVIGALPNGDGVTY